MSNTQTVEHSGFYVDRTRRVEYCSRIITSLPSSGYCAPSGPLTSLLGLSRFSFCCLGTLESGEAVEFVGELFWNKEMLSGDVRWATLIHSPLSGFRFWDALTGGRYELHHRVTDLNRLLDRL